MPFFTVFTPCYNGGKYFKRVFDSMLAQTCNDWEWIIIDDGSTDNSYEIIEKTLEKHSGMDIRLFRLNDNQGKHQVFNKAVDLAKGVLFVPADIDDTFLPTTLYFFKEKWEESLSYRLKLSGISVLCYRDNPNNIVGDRFPKNDFITNALDLSYVHKIRGEKWGCISLEVLRRYRFPAWKGLVNEGYLWFSIAKRYNLICFNVALRHYYDSEDGLMARNGKSVISKKNQKIQLKYQLWFLRNFGFYLIRKNPVLFLKKAVKLKITWIQIYLS